MRLARCEGKTRKTSQSAFILSVSVEYEELMRSISATSVSSRSAIQYRCLLEEGGKPFMPVVPGIFYKNAQEE